MREVSFLMEGYVPLSKNDKIFKHRDPVVRARPKRDLKWAIMCELENLNLPRYIPDEDLLVLPQPIPLDTRPLLAIPKEGLLYVDCVMRFPNPRQQEIENRKPLLSESTGDALWGSSSPRSRARGKTIGVSPEMTGKKLIDGSLVDHRIIAGWIVHDSDEHWKFTARIASKPGPVATLWRLRWREPVDLPEHLLSCEMS
jgi:hypothetical protein